ncbi:MAG TPA: hypothetical protein VFO10_23200 [Oligoflexus sp.]|uniref:hypothetical protein n=1 Tax=Oligoflexus sp. TaxID=1971216 RepID=UPI002D80B831|nr:hypothetical protein [Oligoflexus sp.]HET9240190.1 hypothetical protein [Oligoflexus sp.]
MKQSRNAIQLNPLALFWGLSALSLSATAQAQSFSPGTVYDNAPWISARAAGMSEAVDPIANGMEAPYYNPAAIGGLQYKQDRPAVSQLYFPYLGLALNRSSQSLNRALQNGGDLNDSSVANELLQAYDGEHPYARVSLLPALTMYRIFFAMTYDVRAMSTPNSTDNDLLDVNYREQSGPMLGTSFASSKRNFYVGISAQYLSRKVIEGSFPLATVNDVDLRRKAFRDSSEKYTGVPVHVGALWNGAYSWRPSVSLVARNAGGTALTSSDPETKTQRIKEDLTFGLGLSPNLGKWGMLNVVLEANQLTQKSIPSKDKLRFGTEMTIGNAFGAESGFAVRAGYSMAGISYGLGVNAGMFGLQAASFAEDIGADASRVIERRTVINLGINIADY